MCTTMTDSTQAAIALGKNIFVTKVDVPNRIVHFEAHLEDTGLTKGDKGNHGYGGTHGNKTLPGFPELSVGINIYGPPDALVAASG